MRLLLPAFHRGTMKVALVLKENGMDELILQYPIVKVSNIESPVPLKSMGDGKSIWDSARTSKCK